MLSEFGVKVNTPEIQRAIGAVGKLTAATKQLEDEQKKNAKTSLELREKLLDLKTQFAVGKLSQDDYKKAVRNVRVRMAEEGIEARRTAEALRVLKTATKDATAATRAHEKAERDAERALEKHARAADHAAKLIVRSQEKRTRATEQAAKAAERERLRTAKAAERASKSAAREKERARRGSGYTVTKGIAADIGADAVRGAGRAVVGGVSEAFEQAASFESKMADVSKVVDGLKNKAGEAQPAYHALANELKNMSTQIAVAPTGLADMAAAAGAAGIKGGELTSFVEDAAKTMVAFDISSEEAGNALAKLRANLGINQAEVRGLAGTMNELSNSMASTAAEVLDATLRVGAVGKAAGLSGQEVAGLSSAMIAAGATSEIAATATKNLVLSFSAGAAATRRQREAFSALGMNAEDVAKQFTGTVEQRMAVTRKVIEQMGKLSADKRAATTMQLFGRESLGPIASLTTNLKNYDEAMRIALDTTSAAGSVQKEFEVRSKTTENAVQLLKNRISVFAIEVGEGMMPAINEVITGLGEFFGAATKSGDGIGKTLGEGIKRAWEALREFLGPAEEFPAKLQKMMETAAAFGSAILDVVEAVGSLIGKVTDSEAAFVVMGAAILALTGPIGIVTAALVGMFALMDKAQDEATSQFDAGFTAGGKNDKGSFEANYNAYQEWKQKGKLDKKSRDDDLANLDRINAGPGEMGRHSLQKEEGERGGAVGMHVPAGTRARVGATIPAKYVQTPSPTPEVDKEARFAQLAAKKMKGPLKFSENTELKALSKELDKAIPRKPGGGSSKKHKAETAYEGDLEGEVQRLAKESGKRAGIKAASEGKSRKEQFSAAKAAEEATTKQLHGRVDAGMSLPGNFMQDQLQRAGFQDVANRGTPPPIAVTIIDVKPMAVDLKFTGPVTADPKQLREFVRTMWREDIPQALAQGIREARLGPIY